MRLLLFAFSLALSACAAPPTAAHRESVAPFTFGCGEEPDGGLGPPWVAWDGATLTLSSDSLTMQIAANESAALFHRDETPATASSPGAVYTFKGVDVLSSDRNGEVRATMITSVMVTPSGSDEFKLKVGGAALTPSGFLWGATSVDLWPCKKKGT